MGWEKLIQYTFKYVILPLSSKALAWAVKWFKESREDDKRDDAIDDAVKRLKEAKTFEDRKDALKDLVRGVAALDGSM